jgi:hypothetical protein
MTLQIHDSNVAGSDIRSKTCCEKEPDFQTITPAAPEMRGGSQCATAWVRVWIKSSLTADSDGTSKRLSGRPGPEGAKDALSPFLHNDLHEPNGDHVWIDNTRGQFGFAKQNKGRSHPRRCKRGGFG